MKNNKLPKVILFITVDCLRADYIGALSEKISTPNIDYLAKNGIVFTNAFSNSSGTPLSFPTFFYSRFPWEVYENPLKIWEVHEKMTKIRNNVKAFPKILKKYGYKTISVQPNPYISRYYGWGKEFDVFDDDLSLKNKEKHKIIGILKWLLKDYYPFIQGSADQLFLKFKYYIRNSNINKLFLHLHFMDPHEPLLAPTKFTNSIEKLNIIKKLRILRCILNLVDDKSFISKMSESEKELLLELYKASIIFVDNYIGKIIEYLKKLGIFENTLIIFTADHGQEFGEHGLFIHGRAYDEVLHVPLIFCFPEKFDHQKVDAMVQLMDIPPTILDILNIPIPKYFKGKSLPIIVDFKEKKVHEYVFIVNLPQKFKNKIWWAIRTKRYKYIRVTDSNLNTLKEEFYDLQNDPQEKVNIINEMKYEIINNFRCLLNIKIREYKKELKRMKLLNTIKQKTYKTARGEIGRIKPPIDQ